MQWLSKKFFLSLFFLIGFTIFPASAAYIVSGAGDSTANGTYEAWEIRDGVMAYRKVDGNSTWYLRRCFGSEWVIEPYSSCFFENYYIFSEAAEPPTSGWRGWPAPTPTVGPAGPTISFSSKVFLENLVNDGSFGRAVVLTHNLFDNDGFNGLPNEDFLVSGKAVISNLPAGLTARLIFESPSTLNLTLFGNATNHSQANNSSNISLQFFNEAFLNNDATVNINAEVADISLQFRDVLTVGTNGLYASIASAVAAAQRFDILQLTSEVFTEKNLQINKELAILGAGPDQTIIQAMATPLQESGYIFRIGDLNNSLSEFIIDGVALRHANLNGSNVYGSAIYSNAPLTLSNCHLYDNRTVANALAEGGALASYKSIKIENCLFENNLMRRTSGSQTGGGAISVYGTSIITNSTFVGNHVESAFVSRSTQGGAISFGGSLEIINSTIVGNSSGGYGAGIGSEFSAEKLTLINSIVYNNSANTIAAASADIDLPSATVASYIHSIVGAKSVVSSETAINLISADPLLGVLANNGGSTKTVALLAGSPAIGAGEYAAGYPDLDQRGFSRSGEPDIGAYQYNATLPYYVSFNANGAEGITLPVIGNSFSVGRSVTIPDSSGMAREGFTFLGWNTAADGSGTWYYPGDTYTMTASNLQLFAIYQEDNTATPKKRRHLFWRIPQSAFTSGAS